MNCKILKDFKEFAMRGNVLDMAVGVIIGGAFGSRRPRPTPQAMWCEMPWNCNTACLYKTLSTL